MLVVAQGEILFTFEHLFVLGARFVLSVGGKESPQLSKCFGDRAYHLA